MPPAFPIRRSAVLPRHARSICSWRMSMPSALSRASFILLAVLLLCPVAAGATLREITSEDIASWREIREGALSADSKLLAYQLTPDEGSPQREATVIMRSLTGKVERRTVPRTET